MNTTYLVFSDDYGEHPSSCQHLFRYCPADSTVIWVNTIGMRSPTLSIRDLRKALIKGRKMIKDLINASTNKGPTQLPSGFHVVQPPMLPFARISFVRHFNTWMVRRYVEATLLRASTPSVDISVVTAPNACDYVGRFGEKRITYYCVDDFTEWPGLDHKLVMAMEEKLIQKTDTFIVTSEALQEKFRARHLKTHMITHGVDIDFFRQPPTHEHACLASIPRPRVGYFGLIDERCDQQLVAFLAGHCPDVSFVITGDVTVDTSSLKAYRNVYFTGRLPYAELPLLTQGIDVLMLPYKVNRLTNAIQPLKLKEYLATGKPVLSSPIREALHLSPIITVADTHSEWQEMLHQCLTTPVTKRETIAREEFIHNESWQSKADTFFRLIRK